MRLIKTQISYKIATEFYVFYHKVYTIRLYHIAIVIDNKHNDGEVTYGDRSIQQVRNEVPHYK